MKSRGDWLIENPMQVADLGLAMKLLTPREAVMSNTIVSFTYSIYKHKRFIQQLQQLLGKLQSMQGAGSNVSICPIIWLKRLIYPAGDL